MPLQVGGVTVVDDSRNLVNISNAASFSGATLLETHNILGADNGVYAAAGNFPAGYRRILLHISYQIYADGSSLTPSFAPRTTGGTLRPMAFTYNLASSNGSSSYNGGIYVGSSGNPVSLFPGYPGRDSFFAFGGSITNIAGNPGFFNGIFTSTYEFYSGAGQNGAVPSSSVYGTVANVTVAGNTNMGTCTATGSLISPLLEPFTGWYFELQGDSGRMVVTVHGER